MNKKFLILILVIIPLTFVFSQQFFNPFQYGIKTTKRIETIINDKFKNAVIEKAAELLSEEYPEAVFRAEGDNIINSTTKKVVSDDVIQDTRYKTRENLMIAASDLVLADCDIVKATLNTIEYCHWKTVNVDISGEVLRKIYISPSGYGGPFPRVSPCEKGIGQCLLFFFDRILRILYFGALALGVIFLMWAGILYITKPLEAKNIHQRFIWGIIGIIVGITSFTIVIALENWLAGGLTTEVPIDGTGGEVIETIAPTDSTDGGISATPTPRIIIDTNTAKIDEKNNKFSVFVSAEGNCNLTGSFYNLTKGKSIGSSTVSISAHQFFIYTISTSSFDLGDTVRVVFNSSNCQVSVRQLDIKTRRPREIVTTPPTIKKPIIDLTIRSIYGQQTIYVNIEDLSDLKSILENILGIAVIQRNLYDPPFSMYVTYNVTLDKQSPQNSGSCTIYGRLRGVRINQLSFDKTKAISYTTFNRDFSFTIRYEANRSGPYNIPIYIPLPNNILGFVNLELYHYTGACEEVKVNNQNIATNPFNTTYDIETGRFYSVSGNILRDLFGF